MGSIALPIKFCLLHLAFLCIEKIIFLHRQCLSCCSLNINNLLAEVGIWKKGKEKGTKNIWETKNIYNLFAFQIPNSVLKLEYGLMSNCYRTIQLFLIFFLPKLSWLRGRLFKIVLTELNPQWQSWIKDHNIWQLKNRIFFLLFDCLLRFRGSKVK